MKHYQNKNFTEDDTNKVIFLHVYSYVYTMFICMFTPCVHLRLKLCLHLCSHHIHTMCTQFLHHVYRYVYTYVNTLFTHMLFTPMLSPEKCGYMLTSNLGMKQQYQNKNLTKNDTNKVLIMHVYYLCIHLCYTIFTPMLNHIHAYVFTYVTPCSHLC